jgi:rhodanese-related sulfurtransferase
MLSLLGRSSIIISLSLLIACGAPNDPTEAESSGSMEYATWVGLGPDKWASIWLLQKFVTSGHRIQLLEYDSRPSSVTLFDVPGTEHYRTNDETSFAQLVRAHSLEEFVPKSMIQILHDIEINLWLPDQLSESSNVESEFRQMQTHFGRDRVPYGCYLAFFETLYALTSDKNLSDMPENSAWYDRCENTLLQPLHQPARLIPEFPVDRLLDLMRSDLKVIFVDVREPEEYAESHIPDALNIPIRHLNEDAINQLSEADVVVPYCVKDFRAFEMARLMQERGIERVAILNPYGLKGWIKSGLPVVQRGVFSSEMAQEKLSQCLSRESTCAHDNKAG